MKQILAKAMIGAAIMAGRCFSTDASSPAASSEAPRKATVALVCHLASMQGSDSGQPLGDRTFILDEQQSKVDGWQATFTPYEIRFRFEGGSPGKSVTKFNALINRVSGALILSTDDLGPLAQGKCDKAGTPQF